MQPQGKGLDGAGSRPAAHTQKVHDHQGAGGPVRAQIQHIRQSRRGNSTHPVPAVGERYRKPRVQQHVTDHAAAHATDNRQQQETHHVKPQGARHRAAEQAISHHGCNIYDAEQRLGLDGAEHGLTPFGVRYGE